MTRELAVVIGAGVAACTPKGPQLPKAKGVAVTIDVSRSNPVISWTPQADGLRATQLMVTSPDCASGPVKMLVDTPTVTVTGGTDQIAYWLLAAQPEGYDGPIVFASHAPGTTWNVEPKNLPAGCHMAATLFFPDQSRAVSKSVKLEKGTTGESADADMKAAGLDKPWVSATAAKSVELPPPDEAAQAKVAGHYDLVSIGGKPVPYDYGNGCKMDSATIDFAADGTYTNAYTMSCASGPLSDSGSGKYGVTADRVIMTDGPEPLMLTPDGMTRNGPGGAYVLKKKN